MIFLSQGDPGEPGGIGFRGRRGPDVSHLVLSVFFSSLHFGVLSHIPKSGLNPRSGQLNNLLDVKSSIFYFFFQCRVTEERMAF